MIFLSRPWFTVTMLTHVDLVTLQVKLFAYEERLPVLLALLLCIQEDISKIFANIFQFIKFANISHLQHQH